MKKTDNELKDTLRTMLSNDRWELLKERQKIEIKHGHIVEALRLINDKLSIVEQRLADTNLRKD